MALDLYHADRLAQAPSAVVIDIDNTLYPYTPSHLAAAKATEEKACGLLGVKPDRLQAAFAEARSRIKRQLGDTASSHSRLLYYQGTIESLGLGSQPLAALDLEQTYWRRFLAEAKLFPGAKEFVRDLRSAGIATAVLTDLTAQIQFRKLIYFGLETYFDVIVTSEETGIDKPSGATFQLVLEKLGVPAAETWIIGDDAAKDIAGGAAAGMVTLQKRHDGVRLSERADAAFDDFADLSAWLKANADVVARAETI